MRLSLAGLALAVPIGASACASELTGTLERRCPESAVELHAEQTGLEYASCGSLEPASGCPDAVPYEPTAEEHAALECFAAALAACSPAGLELRGSTEEGAALRTTYLVEPDGQGACRITVLHDDRADTFAAEPGIARSFCEDPTLGSGCPVLQGGTCSEPSRLCVPSRR